MFGVCLDRLLSVPQINLFACADRKMVIFCLSALFHKKITIIQNRYADKEKLGVQRKNLRTPSYAYLRNCISSKEITA
jgi:hypothetical protein